MADTIKVSGARMHNLKNINIEIPKNKLTVITGVSGSGKSSLAFDTLYEEGKRRYLMFSNTQFMVGDVPAFDSITGLSPTVAVEQRITRQSNPRSTVGTRTKISALLAALFSAYGKREGEFDDGLPLSMEMFQKNSPKGMCARCLGKGVSRSLDEDRIFESGSQKLYRVFGLDLGLRGKTRTMLDGFCKHHGLKFDQPVSDLTQEQLSVLIHGDGGKTFKGYIPWIHFICNGAFSASGRLQYLLDSGGYMRTSLCPKCGGSGLGRQASHTTIGGRTITQLEYIYINDLYGFLKKESLSGTKLLEEILVKLECMIDVGLHHLSLSRPVPTLSGGEIQRLFLASYIIAEMDSVIFIFDEPTIGLHEVEKHKLIGIIRNLIERGNTVIAVEHDTNFMKAADYIVDLGPRAGEQGGERIFQGSYAGFMECGDSLTAPYLSGKLSMPVKTVFKPVDDSRLLRLSNCNIHNLRGVSVDIPLGLLVGVAGVSGSGKSSIIADTLVPKLKEMLNKPAGLIDYTAPQDGESGYDAMAVPDVQISGYEGIRRCVIIDQKPIGRARTSCPATYTGVFDRTRKLFAEMPESIAQGFEAGMFSVNSKGKCRACGGDGAIHYHVGFGNFIDVDCEACGATGFTPESLSITVDGKNIKDILEMSVTSAIEYFKDKDKISHRMLMTLDRVGLGYMSLGQKTPTISGGEAQRIKLAKELGKSGSGRNNIYILDEPTTGLSFSDCERLISLLLELVDNGNSVIVTEHDPAVLSNCDHIIEMGPGGGNDGGHIIATGTPARLKDNEASIIGRFLR